MALGSLVVSLGLDAADYISGLSKSEQQARRFGQQMERSIAAGIIKAEIALRAFGAAARTGFDVFQALTTDAGQFQDLAETTTASAEALASLAVAAGTAGVPMQAIADSTNKLTKNLVGVDDESKAAGAALKAIGLELAEFKQLDPVGQYEAVARALSGYADSAGKVAVAQALFGKAGAEQLKVFKALEEQGGRTKILTQQQIEQADAYADAQARAGTELRLYAQAAASEAIPAFNDLTRAAVGVAKEFLGIDKATGQLIANNGARSFAESTVSALAFVIDAADGVVRVFTAIGLAGDALKRLQALPMFGGFAEGRAIIKQLGSDLDALAQKQLFSARLAEQRRASAQAAASANDQSAAEARRLGLLPPARPAIDFAGAADKAAKAARTPADEAKRYLENLQRQLQATQDLSVAETVLADIQAGRIGKVSAAQQEQLLGVAQQIDAAKRLQDQLKAEAEQERDWRAARKRLADEARAVFDATRTPLEKLTIELERQKSLLEQIGDSYEDTYGRAVRAAAEAYKETQEANKEVDKGIDVARELGLTFSSAFEDAIVAGGNLSDVLKGLEKDILRIITRKLVTEPLAEAVTGFLKPGGGAGGLAAGIGSFIGGLFGGGDFAGVYAEGGWLPAGKWGIAGERGPELIRGPAQVLPTNRSMELLGSARGGPQRPLVMNFAFSGPVDRRTQQQVAAAAARGLSAASSRNN